MIPQTVAQASPIPTFMFGDGSLPDISVLQGGNEPPFNRTATTPRTFVQNIEWSWPWDFYGFDSRGLSNFSDKVRRLVNGRR